MTGYCCVLRCSLLQEREPTGRQQEQRQCLEETGEWLVGVCVHVIGHYITSS